MNEKVEKLFKNTVIFAVGNFASRLIAFILIPLFTSYLSTAEYGISDLLLTSVNLIVPILSLSIAEAVFRFGINDPTNSVIILSHGVKFVGFVSVIPLAGIIVFIFLHGYLWGAPFCLLIVLFMFRNLISLFLKASSKNLLFAGDSILYSLYLLIFCYIFLAKLEGGITGFLYAYIFASLFSISGMLLIGKINILGAFFLKTDFILLKKMLSYSAPIVFNTIALYLITYTDRYMIRFMIGAGETGIYAVAAKIPNVIGVVVGVFNQAWLISSVEEFDGEKNIHYYEQVFKYFNIVLSIATVLFLIIIKPLLSIYVTADYYIAWKYIPLLLISTIYSSLAVFFGVIYSSAYKNKAVAKTTIIAGIINFILNYIFINMIGIMGAVVATVISNCIFFLIRLFDTRKFFSFPINSKHMLVNHSILLVDCLMTTILDNAIVVNVIAILVEFIIHFHGIRAIWDIFINKFKRKGSNI